MMPDNVACSFCGIGQLYWSWNHKIARATLRNEYGEVHECGANTPDIYEGWCDKCNAPDLFWVRKDKKKLELIESYGLPHTCEYTPLEDLRNATCKNCKSTEVLWLKKEQSRYLMIDRVSKQKHQCVEATQYMKDWAEALRLDYKFTKKWLKAIPNGTTCKRCKGMGIIERVSRDKRLVAKYTYTPFGVPPATTVRIKRSCNHCKRIGVFSEECKKAYLKDLRKKYWPFKWGKHKWSKVGSLT